MSKKLILLVSLCFGCAVETTDNITVVEASEDDKIVLLTNEAGTGSSPCSPHIVLEYNGKVHSIPSLCPIPQKPGSNPDPEQVKIEKLESENVFNSNQ